MDKPKGKFSPNSVSFAFELSIGLDSLSEVSAALLVLSSNVSATIGCFPRTVSADEFELFDIGSCIITNGIS